MSQPPDGDRINRELEARVNVLESLVIEKSLVDRKALDAILELYEHKIGPRNGAQVVARAWVDPAFRQWLLTSPDRAIASLGYTGRQGEHVVVVENTPDLHNVIVCTLCSCYPWPLLGLPPSWYRSKRYRARIVSEPRKVLAEFGTPIPDDVAVRVHDSLADLRYLVLPRRPEGTAGWTEEQLAAIVTRDHMVGVAVPSATPAN